MQPISIVRTMALSQQGHCAIWPYVFGYCDVVLIEDSASDAVLPEGMGSLVTNQARFPCCGRALCRSLTFGTSRPGRRRRSICQATFRALDGSSMALSRSTSHKRRKRAIRSHMMHPICGACIIIVKLH